MNQNEAKKSNTQYMYTIKKRIHTYAEEEKRTERRRVFVMFSMSECLFTILSRKTDNYKAFRLSEISRQPVKSKQREEHFLLSFCQAAE